MSAIFTGEVCYGWLCGCNQDLQGSGPVRQYVSMSHVSYSAKSDTVYSTERRAIKQPNIGMPDDFSRNFCFCFHQNIAYRRLFET